MATSAGKERDSLEMLRDLIKLDHAAAEAYDEAIEHLDNAAHKQQLEVFKRDHERHIAELSPILRQLGGKVPDDGGMKEMLTEGKVKLSSLMGDRAILKAMKTNEDDTNTAYERAVTKAPVEARSVIERGLADERRHREWIVAQLGEKGSTLGAQDRARSRSDEPRPGPHGPR